LRNNFSLYIFIFIEKPSKKISKRLNKMLNSHFNKIDILSSFENSKTVMEVENQIKNRSHTSELGYFPSFFHFSYTSPCTSESVTWLKESIHQLMDCEIHSTLISKIDSVLKHLLLLKQHTTPLPEPTSLFARIESELESFLYELTSSEEKDLNEDSFEMVPFDESSSLDDDFPPHSPSITHDVYDAYSTILTHVGGWINPPKISDLFDLDKIPGHYMKSIKKLIEDPAGRLSTQESFDCMEILCSKEENKFSCEALGIGMTGKEYIKGREPSRTVKKYFKSPFVKKTIEQKGSRPHDLLFIPFVYKGSSLIEMIPGADPGHIIMITVSFADKTVEYYDSLAYAPEDWTCYEDFRMDEDLEKIKDFCFPNDSKAKILSQNQKQQHDWHSCGIHVLYYMKERLSQKSFHQIVTSSMGNGEIQKIRIEFATLLANSQ